MKFDAVIIGGGPAGVQAAISARNTYPEKRIGLVRKEQKSLVPCGIPYVLHSLETVDDDILPDTLLKKSGVELVIGEVSARDGSVLSLTDGRQIGFEKLVLATGSSPIKPGIAGVDLPGIYILSKDYDSLKELREAAQAAHRVVIVGGGYVGLELADELRKADKEVVLVEAQSSLLPSSVDPEYGLAAQEELARVGVEVILGASVKAFVGKETLSGADLDDGRWVTADMAIVAVGFRPSVKLARKFGVDTDKIGGVAVDEYLRTSDPAVYAIGDCASKRSCYTGAPEALMLASTAMSQGRLAGSNLFGIKVVKTFSGAIGSFATKVGKLALGATGLNESQAKALELDYVVGRSEAVDRHPGKLPGASKITLKLLFARNSQMLLGAQMTGGDSVGESVNMMAVMIQNKMTALEIDTLQIGTHPLLTPSPLAYPIITATVDAILQWTSKRKKTRSGS